MKSSRRRLLLLAFAIAAGAGTAWVGSLAGSTTVESTRASLLWTGRLAFFVFLIPWTARPLRALFGGTWTAALVRGRRSAGIVYGGLQIVHLALIAELFRVSATQPVPISTVIVGGLGLLLVLAMTWTSFDGPARRIGPKRWRQIHKNGVWVCGFIYFYDFLVVPIEREALANYLPFTVLTVLALGLRVAAWVRTTKTLEPQGA